MIVVEGEGRAFCAGYDLVELAEESPRGGTVDNPLQQEKQPWDSMVDYAVMKRHTEDFMSLWRSQKPTIAKVHGYAVAGGSDIALCCDLLVMADDAQDRLHADARLGLPDDGDVDLSPRRGARQADDVHRRPSPAARPPSGAWPTSPCRPPSSTRRRDSSRAASPACRARTW